MIKSNDYWAFNHVTLKTFIRSVKNVNKNFHCDFFSFLLAQSNLHKLGLKIHWKLIGNDKYSNICWKKLPPLGLLIVFFIFPIIKVIWIKHIGKWMLFSQSLSNWHILSTSGLTLYKIFRIKAFLPDFL